MFENVVFRQTKLIKSNITWSGFFHIAMGELDLTSTVLTKTLTDPSQVTQAYVDEAVRRAGPLINSLDISIKSKIMAELKSEAEKYGTDVKGVDKSKDSYGKVTAEYSNAAEGYGSSMLSMIRAAANAYETSNPYQTKKDKRTDPYRR